MWQLSQVVRGKLHSALAFFVLPQNRPERPFSEHRGCECQVGDLHDGWFSRQKSQHEQRSPSQNAGKSFVSNGTFVTRPCECTQHAKAAENLSKLTLGKLEAITAVRSLLGI